MTPSEAAKRLGYRSVGAVRNLIILGILNAKWIEVAPGRSYYEITEADLRKFRETYKPKQRGKPRGEKNK